MEILRDAAENVFDLLRRQQDRIRVRRSGHNPDEPVLSPTLLHTFTGVYVPVSFLPDSEHFVGGCYDGTVRKWRISDGREVGKAKGHGSRVSVVAMSGDGKTVASGGGDGKVVLWSIDTCEDLVESQGKHSDWVTSLSFAPDAQRVASGSFDGSIIVWSATTGEIVASVFRGKEDWVLSLAFSPAGDRIASCGFMGGVQICDSSSGEEILKIPALASVCWSPDGSQLICGTDNGTIEFIDSSNGARLATWRGHEGAIYSISVFQGGTWLTSASLDHTVRLWSTSTHQQLASLDHPNQAYDVSVSPNGRYIASGGFGSDSDHGVMHIWRLPDIDTTIQEVKEDPAASRPDASGSQSVPVNKDGPAKIASAEDATPEQDPRDEDDDPQDSARDQSNHTDRRASWESWMDMPAVPPSRVPADDGIYAHFFDEPLAFQSKEVSCLSFYLVLVHILP
ncbi:quinon protein alcohol dehydrogenase-like superfamily [Phlebopus sp. FC_14]|nr:quinon protein alcohol dehydrogenase-like superfamily [Phlebopus sp. FC_14]